jgi:hypothetical protein
MPFIARNLALVSILAASVPVSAQTYFPGRHDWEKRAPEEMGMSSVVLAEAIDFAIAHESDAPKDLALAHELSDFAREPFGFRVGPTTVRAPLNGLVLRSGYIVAEWGDTSKVDMTFSVTKTFVSTVVGLAFDRGLIGSLDSRAKDYVGPEFQDLFASEHNQRLGRNALGKARLGGPARGGEAFGLPEPEEARARYALQVQRRTRQPPRPRRVERLAASPASSFERARHGTDRSLEDLALAWL